MKLLRVLLYIAVAAFLLIALIPKKELYYLLESELKKQKIVLSNEELNDFWLGLEIKNANLYYEELKVGEIERIKVYPLLFWNAITIKNLTVGSDAASILPKNTKSLTASFSLLNPLKVELLGEGDFGTLKGGFLLLEQNISVELNATDYMKKNYSQILSRMKPNNGVYIYEQNIK